MSSHSLVAPPLSSGKERYLAAAAVAFAGEDAELRHHLEGELREQLLDVESEDAALHRAAARLEQRIAISPTRRPQRKWLRWAALAVAVLCTGDTVRQVAQHWEGFRSLSYRMEFTGFPRLDLAARLRSVPPAQHYLFLPDQGLPPAQIPEPRDFHDLLHYEAYVTDFYGESGNPPPDMGKTYLALDPDNGLSSLLAMVDEFNEPGKYSLNALRQWLHQAALQPRFRSSHEDLTEARRRLLPPVKDVVEDEENRMLLGQRSGRLLIILHSAGEVVDEIARDIASTQDYLEFTRLSRDWRAILEKAARTDCSANGDEMAALHRMTMDPAPAMVLGARQLRLSQEEAFYMELMRSEKGRGDRLARQQREAAERVDLYGAADVRERSSLIAPPSLEELAPGRHADHALLQRLLMGMVAILLGVPLLSVAYYRFRGGRVAAALARHARDLRSDRSQRWACAAAVLPLLAVQAYAWLGPSSSTAWSVRYGGIFMALGQALAALLLSLLLPILCVRRGLRKDAGFLRLTEGRPWGAWLAVAAAAGAFIVLAALPWAHLFREALFDSSYWYWLKDNLKKGRWSGPPVPWLLTATGLLSMAVLLLLGLAGRALLSSSRRLPGRLAISAALVRPYVCALLTAGLLLPLLHGMERSFYARDTLRQPDPAGGPGDYLNAEMARAGQAELRAMLERAQAAAQKEDPDWK